MTKTVSKPAQPDDDQADDQAEVVEDTRPRRDLLEPLTIAELDAGSRQLGTSLVRQIQTRGERYEQALAVVLWLHARRTDRKTEPGALLKGITALTFTELSARIDDLALQLGAADTGEAADPLE